MRRRVIAIVLPCCFFFALLAAPAKAGVIEQVKTDANGLVPATVTVTLSNPTTESQLARVCLTSKSAGQLLCIII